MPPMVCLSTVKCKGDDLKGLCPKVRKSCPPPPFAFPPVNQLPEGEGALKGQCPKLRKKCINKLYGCTFLCHDSWLTGWGEWLCGLGTKQTMKRASSRHCGLDSSLLVWKSQSHNYEATVPHNREQTGEEEEGECHVTCRIYRGR